MTYLKKFLFLTMASMLVFTMTACSESGDNGKENINNTPNVVTYDTGKFTVEVPEGWKEFPVSDVFGEEEDGIDHDVIQIVKGGENAYDTLTHPYVYINFYDENTTMATPSADFYDEGKALEPITIGSRTWEGFDALTMGYPITVLWTYEGDTSYQVTLYREQGEESISVEDADVKQIIASLTTK